MHARVVLEVGHLSNQDTNGAEESVIVSEVSSFQRLKCMQEWYLGWEKVGHLSNPDTNEAEESVIVSEVSFHFRG